MTVDPRVRYDQVAARTAARMLSAYSTSFGLGTRLLGHTARRDIRAVYGLVRLADEVVDTYRGPTAAAELDELEAATARALQTGYSANLVVHAFARTARHTGIDAQETGPFFASMRADLHVARHDETSYRAYVHGSAEVVGVMCLKVFLNDGRDPAAPVRRPGARALAGAQALGAAFQKVNFLRDLGADGADLGRAYFPGSAPGRLSAADAAEVLADVAGDLRTARACLDELPLRARCAVSVTLALYEDLLRRLSALPPAELASRRVRVPDPVKLVVATRAVARTATGRTTAARTATGRAAAGDSGGGRDTAVGAGAGRACR